MSGRRIRIVRPEAEAEGRPTCHGCGEEVPEGRRATFGGDLYCRPCIETATAGEEE